MVSEERLLLALVLHDLDPRISETTNYRRDRYMQLSGGEWAYDIPPKKQRHIYDGVKPYEDDPDYLPSQGRVKPEYWASENMRIKLAYAPEIDTVIYRYTL